MTNPSNGAPNGAPQEGGEKAKAKRTAVVTLVTVHHREHEKADQEELAPGRHTLPAEVADHLIARGLAVLATEAEAAAAAKAKAQDGDPRVLTGDAAKAAAEKRTGKAK